ncbi:MAG: S8 family serine peptidase [Pseudomonadota bacterium]|nr:S8 family serine peptidase [Pseudomonadota bacterium]
MSSRFLAIASLGVLAAISAVSAVGPSQPMLSRPNSPGNSPLHVAGSRTLEQRQSASGSKFDASLAEISRHVSSVRPGHAAEDLHALNPAARFMQPASTAVPLVLIDAVTKGDPQKLKAALVGLGLQRASQYSNDVGGWLPVDQLDAATTLTELHAIRAAMPRTRSGAVTSQGDYAQNSDLVRSQNALTGAGITVGVLSDSYDCYTVYAANGVPASGNAGYANNGFNTTAAGDIQTGDLPSTVNVIDVPTDQSGKGEANCMNYGAPVQLPFGDEGRAIMQIIHDVAPGAGLAFHTAENSEADFANGIGALAAPVAGGGGGAKVIVDDVGYFDEPFFQDGIVAQAIDSVVAQGVAYFSSAGNNGTLAYNNNAPSFATAGTGQNANEMLLNFNQATGGAVSTTLPVSIPPLIPGEFVAIVAEWDQPYFTGAPNSGGAKNQIDLCIEGAVGNDIINNLNPNGSLGTATCTGANALGHDPVQVMFVYNRADAAGNSQAETLNIVVGLVSGAAPGRIKIVVEGNGANIKITQFATNSGTVQGHPGAAGAAAVGAAFFANTPSCGAAAPTLESFSSAGGDPILFDATGTRLTAPVTRQKPDFVGPDGGNDTFLGFKLQTGQDTSTIAACQNNAAFPNFFGTSAAAPHVAGIAVLLLQADPSLTPAQLNTVLQQSAAPIGTAATASAPNYAAGYGFVQANVAAGKITAIVPAAPTLTLASSSIVVGSSTTLTWSSANNQGCTATGSWSGAQASTGTLTVTPTAVGTDTYTLACTNVAGTSAPTSVTLSVTAAAPPPTSSGGGGGGALGITTLLGLLGMCAERMRRSRRSRQRDHANIA